MSSPGVHCVTGAFGFSGRYIAQRLLDSGCEVRTLTNSPDRPNPFGGKVKACPLCFDDADRLAESLRGADVLYNTYWVRFKAERFAHASAVDNTLRLFEAAKRAGVRRIVHTSITNPSEDSPFEYFRGKARLEGALKDSGVAYSILRPAVLFGKEDILINNIAWAVRRLPVIGIFGDGRYRLQPIHVDDFAKLAVEEGMKAAPDSNSINPVHPVHPVHSVHNVHPPTAPIPDPHGNVILDAIGPETYEYRDLVRTIAAVLGKRRLIARVPILFGILTAKILGMLLGDVMLTREEVGGLMAGLLCVNSAPTGSICLSEWTRANAATLGVRYHSELARRRDRKMGIS